MAWISSDGGLTWIQAPELADDCCSISALRDDRAVVAASSDVGDQIGAIVSTIDLTSHTWTRQTPPTMRDFRPVSAQVLGRSFVIFGWSVHRDPDEFIVDDQPVAFSSVDGFRWAQAILPEAWKGQSPVSVATRANNLVAIVGPLATLNGPPESLTQTLWFGTASN